MRMDDPRTDEQLMTQVGRDDRRAYETLFLRWRDRVHGFLLKRTGAGAEADDALQQTWLNVYRARHRYDPSRPFRPWLFAIAANAGRDASRPQPRLFVLDPEPDEPTGLAELVAGAIAALDADDRRLLLLAIEGFDGPEIADMLGIGAGAVRMRLHRARERVRAAVRGNDA
jgi:RNA polymerase sigma factor (sigma-70 family)